MSAREFAGWQAFYQLEPFGSDRDNWHTALLATILTNANRGKNAPPTSMGQFFYKDPGTIRFEKDASLLAWLEGNSRKSDGH